VSPIRGKGKKLFGNASHPVTKRFSWQVRMGGILYLALPHIIGAPVAVGEAVVPEQLVRRFAIASLAMSCLFWLAVGIAGGILSDRYTAEPTATPD
jgi:predicted cobalt transporter CbtA